MLNSSKVVVTSHDAHCKELRTSGITALITSAGALARAERRNGTDLIYSLSISTTTVFPRMGTKSTQSSMTCYILPEAGQLLDDGCTLQTAGLANGDTLSATVQQSTIAADLHKHVSPAVCFVSVRLNLVPCRACGAPGRKETAGPVFCRVF